MRSIHMQCGICLEYKQMETQQKALRYEIPSRPLEVIDIDVFMINNKTLFCIVDYHSEFPVVRKGNSLSSDDLVQTRKLIFAEYGL